MRSIVWVTLGALLTACAVEQDERESSSAPLGLWVFSLGAASSTVSIDVGEVDGAWRATIDGASAGVTVVGATVRINGTAGQYFSGEVVADGSALRGDWFQPASPVAYLDMATPTVLPAVAPGRWAGGIDAQPRPFTVYLEVFEDENAEVRAVIRNPERNEIQGATVFAVESAGTDAWLLTAGSGERQVRRRLERVSDQELSLEFSRLDRLSMKPALGALATGYFGRQLDDLPATLTSPPRLGDGWEVATPEEAGFDRAALDALVAELAAATPRERRPQLIHALLVSHRGRLVIEEYFHGHDRETAHDVRSLGKVFGPILVGALRQQGIHIDVDSRLVAEVLTEAGEPVDDPRKSDITLAHLMTYTSGLDCNVVGDSIGSEWRMWEQQAEPDYWLYTARLPVLHEPGTRYAYCSGSANLVGAALRSAADESVLDLFDRLLARPLEFGTYHFNLAPNGAGYLGGGAYLRPRDILKLGALHASGGIWREQRILPEAWVDASTEPRVPITPATTGMSADDFADNYFESTQAYVWRVNDIVVGERRFNSYEATGNGGQIVLVVPELELAVVFTGGNYRMGGIWGRWRDEIVGGRIIPAMIVD
ncbi:MAG: serine hydrolase domain-containing protein [Pseudomonadota bacterium]